MAAPKNPESYPVAFQMLLDRFKDSAAEPVRTYYPRAQDATKVRFTFYSFKKSLQRPGREADLRAANGILVRLLVDPAPGTGATLEFSLRDNLGWALDLEAAMRATPQRGQEVAGAWAGEVSAPPMTSDAVVDKYLGR